MRERLGTGRCPHRRHSSNGEQCSQRLRGGRIQHPLCGAEPALGGSAGVPASPPPAAELPAGVQLWEPLTSTIAMHTPHHHRYMYTPPYMCVCIIYMYNLGLFLVSGGSILLIQLKVLPEMTLLQIFRFLKKPI